MPRLAAIELQCAASAALAPPQPTLVDENLRGYVRLLSAHFQGFCRDLYTECAQTLIGAVDMGLREVAQLQFETQRQLDHKNPTVENLRKDFQRFSFKLDLSAANPANPLRVSHLDQLSKWRNIAAHRGTVPIGHPPLGLQLLQDWRNSCDGLAASLDVIMYNRLMTILGRPPW